VINKLLELGASQLQLAPQLSLQLPVGRDFRLEVGGQRGLESQVLDGVLAVLLQSFEVLRLLPGLFQFGLKPLDLG